MNRLAAEDIPDVAAGRAVIDDLDTQILQLVAQRRDASRRVQHLRRVAGTPGIQYARENEIIARYAAGLGSPGTRLALLVLELCRGDQARVDDRRSTAPVALPAARSSVASSASAGVPPVVGSVPVAAPVPAATASLNGTDTGAAPSARPPAPYA